MMTRRDKEAERARLNRRELVDAGLTRRELAKMGLLTGAGMLIAKSGLSARALNSAGESAGGGSSPSTRPFVAPFRRLDVAQPCSEAAMGPAATAVPNTAAGEARRRDIQRFDDINHHGNYYSVHEQEGQVSMHPDLPMQTIWGFGEKLADGTIRAPQYPGPVYHARYGTPNCVRMNNDLPGFDQHIGFGRPETTTHLHNGHTAPESDGNPEDHFGPGTWYDQHYPNIYAGYDQYSDPDPVTGLPGDPRQTLGTLWYHDHRAGFTAQNTYRGLQGMYLLYGAHDSGDETDTNAAAFRLPSGEFDVPMLFADKVFEASSGQMYFDMFNLDGIVGDKFTVNGTIQPVMQVHPRKYRFRCLNGGPSRFYQLFLTDQKTNKQIPYKQISSDGNLLPGPVDVTSITLSVAERCDIVIDFSKFVGKSLYFENRMAMKDGRGPDKNTLKAGQGNFIMRFDVVLPVVADPSQVPAQFFELPPMDLSAVATTRTFRFERTKGAWAINGKFFNPNRVDAKVKQGTSEIWVLQNNSGGWQHPIHIHHEEFQILSRNGKTPPANERGRKDVVRLGYNEEVRFHMRFRDWLGKYPLHCHNTIHEDHSMMTLWEIVE